MEHCLFRHLDAFARSLHAAPAGGPPGGMAAAQYAHLGRCMDAALWVSQQPTLCAKVGWWVGLAAGLGWVGLG